jgi:hypothetical protein
VRLLEPVERHSRIAPADPAIGKNRQHAVEIGRAREEPPGALDDRFLVEWMGRNGSGEGYQSWEVLQGVPLFKASRVARQKTLRDRLISTRRPTLLYHDFASHSPDGMMRLIARSIATTQSHD